MTGFADDPDLAVVTHETDLLMETIHTLDDEAVRGPSLCEGWSRGHVLTHIARNADGLRSVLRTAAGDGPGAMYPSQEARTQDIEAGAGRSASELESDVEISDDEFLDAVADVTPDQMSTRVPRVLEGPGGEVQIPVGKVVVMRLREVVFHHVDLDAGYSFEDAPADFVTRELGDSAIRFTDEPPLILDAGDAGSWRYGREAGDGGAAVTVSGTPGALLTWVSGRGGGSGLTSSTGSLPTLPAWG